jgi:hypothetical protein
MNFYYLRKHKLTGIECIKSVHNSRSEFIANMVRNRIYCIDREYIEIPSQCVQKIYGTLDFYGMRWMLPWPEKQ